MTPYDTAADDRFRELAAILAAGVLRLPHSAPAPASSQTHPESATTGLEVPSETVLCVTRG